MRYSRSFSALFLVLTLLCSLKASAQEKRALDPARKMSQYVFETWSEDEGLPQSTVSSIVSTPDGYLWVGTQEGLVRYNGLEFHVFDKGNSSAFSEDHTIESLLVDSDGRLWVGLGQGLLVYENGKFHNLRLSDGSTIKTVQSIVEKEGGQITIATATEGVYTVVEYVLKELQRCIT